jgi:glycosidase
MRRSIIRRWALPAVFWLAMEDGVPLCGALPPGPAWLQTAVFYQIYPQSFYDSNGDGIGDLRGITAKLDYIYSIGCNAIWLNPIFESPFGDAGYDVADFYRVAGSRTPMQWSREKNAGFSTAPADELYLPIDSAESRPNVASEENDPASMLNFTRALLKLRWEASGAGQCGRFSAFVCGNK